MRSRRPVQDEAPPLSDEKRRLYAHLLTSLVGIMVGTMEAILAALARIEDDGLLRRATVDLPKEAALRLVLAALSQCAAELDAQAERLRSGLPQAGVDGAADAPPGGPARTAPPTLTADLARLIPALAGLGAASGLASVRPSLGRGHLALRRGLTAPLLIQAPPPSPANENAQGPPGPRTSISLRNQNIYARRAERLGARRL